LLRPALFGVRERLDYRRYGGAPLLGIDGVVMVGHGRSDGQAIASAVKTAAAAADSGVLDALRGSVGGD
jgi:glycerol-3-phosphate acyltransferase PlsX